MVDFVNFFKDNDISVTYELLILIKSMILNPNNENAGHEFDIKDFEEVKWHKMAIETMKSFEIEKVQAFQKILLKFPSGLGDNIDASEIIHTQEHFPLKSATFRVKRSASSRWSSSLLP